PVKAKYPAATQADDDAVKAAAQALSNGRKTVILLSGKALRSQALQTASRIAAKTGARIMAQQSNGRIERGAGRVIIDRVPFSVDLALKALEGTEQLILIGARTPVAFFAYPNKPSVLIPKECQVISMTRPTD